MSSGYILSALLIVAGLGMMLIARGDCTNDLAQCQQSAQGGIVASDVLDSLPDVEVVGDPPRLVYDAQEVLGPHHPLAELRQLPTAGGTYRVRLCWEERPDGTWEPVAYAEGEQ